MEKGERIPEHRERRTLKKEKRTPAGERPVKVEAAAEAAAGRPASPEALSASLEKLFDLEEMRQLKVGRAKKEGPRERSSWEIAEELASAEEGKPPTVLERLRKSKAVKIAYRTAAVLGLSGLLGREIAKAEEQAESKTAAYELIDRKAAASPYGEARKSGFAFDLPAEDDQVRFENGAEANRADLLDLVNEEYTKMAKKNETVYRLLSEKCSTKLADGETGLDALTCDAIYGDQVRISADGLGVLSAASGYAPEELKLHADVIRNSVTVRPSSMPMPGSIIGMSYYGERNVPDVYRPIMKDLYGQRYKDASEIAFGVIRGLDLAQKPKPEQEAAVKSLQRFIRAQIDLGNAWLGVANDITHLDRAMVADALMTGLKDPNTGKMSPSDIHRLEEARDRAATERRILLAHEADEAGPIHGFAEMLERAQGQQAQDIFRSAVEAGRHVDFFKAQLEGLQKIAESGLPKNEQA